MVRLGRHQITSLRSDLGGAQVLGTYSINAFVLAKHKISGGTGSQCPLHLCLHLK